MSPRTTLTPHTLVLAFVVAASSAQAQTPGAPQLANAGTLTCTTSEAPAQSSADALLSCRFHALSGGNGSLTGYIAREGNADLPAGKRVLVWSVLTATAEIEPSALEGKYTGETSGLPTGRLTGGRANDIVLLPVTAISQPGDKPVPTVLELRLEPVRA